MYLASCVQQHKIKTQIFVIFCSAIVSMVLYPMVFMDTKFICVYEPKSIFRFFRSTFGAVCMMDFGITSSTIPLLVGNSLVQ